MKDSAEYHQHSQEEHQADEIRHHSGYSPHSLELVGLVVDYVAPVWPPVVAQEDLGRHRIAVVGDVLVLSALPPGKEDPEADGVEEDFHEGSRLVDSGREYLLKDEQNQEREGDDAHKRHSLELDEQFVGHAFPHVVADRLDVSKERVVGPLLLQPLAVEAALVLESRPLATELFELVVESKHFVAYLAEVAHLEDLLKNEEAEFSFLHVQEQLHIAVA